MSLPKDEESKGALPKDEDNGVLGRGNYNPIDDDRVADSTKLKKPTKTTINTGKSPSTGKIIGGIILLMIVIIPSALFWSGFSFDNSADSNNVYDIYERKTSECNRYGSPGNFPSMENQFAWNDCMNSANSWLNSNLP